MLCDIINDMSKICVEQLNFAYGNSREILKDLDFSVEEGEYVAILGPSGCGKSTLCHILCGIIPNVVDGRITGEVHVGGISLREAELKDLAKTIGFVMQDADRQIVSATVEDELAFGPENFCVSPEEIRIRVDGVLDLFGLTDMKDRDPNRLSAGEKKLVTIGSVLVLEPGVILLDEPFSPLDKENKQKVMSAIEILRKQGKTVVVVEHDRDSVARADRWILLEDGRIKSSGPPEMVKGII